MSPVPTPRSRPDAIASQLRDEILRGDYRPGERLPGERAMASRLGAHRSSVREALRKLEQLRLVIVRPGGGALVNRVEDASVDVLSDLLVAGGRLDRALAAQLLDVREMLIAGSVRFAVERGDEDQLLRARELLRRLGSASLDDDEFVEVKARLVTLMAEASGNLVLRLVRNALEALDAARLERARALLRPPHEVLAPIARDLDAALGRRDAVGAEEATRRLMRATRARVLAALELLEREDADSDTAPAKEDA